MHIQCQSHITTLGRKSLSIHEVTIFELIKDIIETNLLTKLHKDWTINKSPRVNKANVDIAQQTTDKRRSQKLNMSTLCSENCPPPSSHVIQLTGTIFEINCHIKEKNVLSKFHENWAKNVTYCVHMFSLYTYREKCPAQWRQVFSPISTIFELILDIN
ncbi:hypothetical protein DPMN_044472 [Dreissena polymorpha]|uniref:Uncharacterized protein n=1 Tax=Dreissena polymorpha TaxID=45954 RepID=A0A9D4HYS1_DREPO|nr:hypothetical protein DPMN_044472 [Dreissena polymorpha]